VLRPGAGKAAKPAERSREGGVHGAGALDAGRVDEPLDLCCDIVPEAVRERFSHCEFSSIKRLGLQERVA
jgi:hypothetical protein